MMMMIMRFEWKKKFSFPISNFHTISVCPEKKNWITDWICRYYGIRNQNQNQTNQLANSQLNSQHSKHNKHFNLKFSSKKTKMKIKIKTIHVSIPWPSLLFHIIIIRSIQIKSTLTRQIHSSIAVKKREDESNRTTTTTTKNTGWVILRS